MGVTFITLLPEWTIQKVRWLSHVSYDEKSYEGRHCIECNSEMWSDFDLGYKSVIARVNSILDKDGKIISTIGENIILETRKLYLQMSIMEDAAIGSAGYNYYLLIFSKEFVKQYGIRRDEYVDLVLLGISSRSDTIEMVEEIYPKRFVTGKIVITPSGSKPNPIGITQPLLEQNLGGDFYKELIQEINLAYSYQLYRSTIVLVRKLLENLLIDLLRTKYGMKKIELFYNTDQSRFLEFHYLVKNLNNSKADFAPYTSGFDDKFFNFITKFRESANSSAHALESFMDKSEIENDKTKLNHYIKVIKNAINMIKSSS